MSWFRVDDGFHTAPEAMAASAGAMRLWTLAGSWSARHGTDGFVPTDLIRLLDDRHRNARRAADHAVSAGLWKPALGGWQFTVWNGPSASELDDRRDRDRDRKRHLRSIPGGVE
jgi:hypothetical protein